MATTVETKSPGEMLRDALKSRNWTQKELAERSGISQPFISEICRGTRTISPRVAIAFERVFGTLTAEEWLSIETQRRLREAREEVSA